MWFTQMYIWKCAYDLHMRNMHVRLTAAWIEIVPVSPFVSLSLTFENTVSQAKSRK